MNALEYPAQYGEVVSIIVDEQNDFFPGGALGVTRGDEVINPTNTLADWTRSHGGQVLFTRDKHNPETKHFARNGGPWVDHCVKYDGMDLRAQGPEGAALHPRLRITDADAIASKGMSNEDDGYSGMEARIEQGTSILSDIVADLPAEQQTVEAALGRLVRVNQEVGRRTLMLVCGLATDYCVKATVIDALRTTDRTWVDVVAVEDAMRAVDLAYDDGARALEEMKRNGALFAQTYEIIDGVIIDRRGER